MNIDKTKFLDILYTLREHINLITHDVDRIIADLAIDDENKMHIEKLKHYDGLEDFAKKHLNGDITSYYETFEEKECSPAWWSTLQGLSMDSNCWVSIPGGYATVGVFYYATNPPIAAYQVHVWKK